MRSTGTCGVIVFATFALLGCQKEISPQISLFLRHIEGINEWPDVNHWRYVAVPEDVARHIDWLDRSLAWDIEGAVAITMALPGLASYHPINKAVRSGLSEIAGSEHSIIMQVTSWWPKLGAGPCSVKQASDEDMEWLKERLKLPVPVSVDVELRQIFAGYAKRASEIKDIARVECSGPSYFLVGVLGDRLVPIMRDIVDTGK